MKIYVFLSNTYEKIEENADKIWKRQRYDLVYDYFYKSLFPRPLNMIYYLYFIMQMITYRIKNRKSTQSIDSFYGLSK